MNDPFADTVLKPNKIVSCFVLFLINIGRSQSGQGEIFCLSVCLPDWDLEGRNSSHLSSYHALYVQTACVKLRDEFCKTSWQGGNKKFFFYK